MSNKWVLADFFYIYRLLAVSATKVEDNALVLINTISSTYSAAEWGHPSDNL